ncbi:MAG: ACP S-malonyltransferase [Firmicutes bacterium]|nr:ACP S-malonyltransferase [Bacillota bacterium]MDH7494903.1 ACP S-malonyltransferase [Bacillota bacterium]
MNRIALVFPGQGAQYVGMGKELASRYAEARQVFEEADDALGFRLSELCFQGSAEDLALTQNTQPAVLTVSVAVFRVLESMGMQPSIVAGHSLGEYSALVAAGCLGFSQAVRLVRRRGELMQAAVPPGVGAMAAIVGLGRIDVVRCCEDARNSGAGDVNAANFNAPDQVVISGETGAVRVAGELCSRAGARRVIPLRVSGPFHSKLMTSASSAFEAELRGVDLGTPAVPVVCNVTGRASCDADELREMLVKQMSSPVLWEESVRYMWETGARAFVEAGPGKTLTGLVRRIVPEAQAVAAEASAPMEDALEFIKGVR